MTNSGSNIETWFGPDKIIFFAISIPKPRKCIIKIFKCVDFRVVSVPIVPICREYKFVSIPSIILSYLKFI